MSMSLAEQHLFFNGTLYNPGSLESKSTLIPRYLDKLGQLNFAASFPDTMTLHDFLKLQREIQKTTEANSKVALPTLLKAPQSDSEITKETRELYEEVNKSAGKQMLQMFMDLYMAPFGVTDIKYRLGKVTGVKPNVRSDPITGFPPPLLSPQLNMFGNMYTRTNLATSWKVKTIGNHGNIVESLDSYINLFFPPYQLHTLYKPDQTLVDIKIAFADRTNPWYIAGGPERQAFQTFNEKTGQIARPDFTYREPAYKAINDNIMLLQYMFEQITGVVSTYLTEWDLSVYMQEGLLQQTGGVSNVIWLLHRMINDNPMGYTDERAFTFGVVNAAASKLFRSSERLWDPGTYPLSSYYKIPEKEVFTEGGTSEDPDLDIVEYPKFYLDAKQDFSTATTFRDKLILWDKKKAALSGWANWSLFYWKAFYNGPSDSLTNADLTMTAAEMNNLPADDVIDMNKENFLGNQDVAGSSPKGTMIQKSGSKTFLTPRPVISAGQFVQVGVATPFLQLEGRGVQNMIGGGGATDGNGGEFGGPGSESVGMSADQSMKLAERLADGYTSAITQIDSDSPQNMKMANTTGVPQHNPTFYGGPHGRWLSPKAPQSYFEPENGFLRNIPRVSGDTYSSFETANKNAYDKGADKYYSYRGPHDQFSYNVDYKKADQCPALGMQHFLKGDCTYTWHEGKIWGETCQRFKGKIIQVRWCSAYADYSDVKAPDGSAITRWANDERWEWENYYQETYQWNGNYWWGSYYWYWNKYARSYWNGSRWVASILTPWKTGYFACKVSRPYKRYTVESMPTAQWYITQFKKPSLIASSGTLTTAYNQEYSGFNWTPYTWNKWWSYAAPTYSAAYTNEVCYKLSVPGGGQGDSIDFGTTTAYHSGNETRLMKHMLGDTREDSVSGHKTTLIFCEGSGQTYAQRMANGPSAMFKMPCSVQTYKTVAFATTISAITPGPNWSISQTTSKVAGTYTMTYIDVRPDQIEWIRTDLDKDPWTNINSMSVDMKTGMSPSDIFKRNTVVFEDFLKKQGTAQSFKFFGATQTGSMQVSGWGILSGIQGLYSDAETSVIEGDYFRNMLNLPFHDNTLKEDDPISNVAPEQSTITARIATIKAQALPDIKRSWFYWNDDDYDTDPKTDEDGNEYFVEDGVPAYRFGGYLDSALCKSISRLFTTATFYPALSDGYAYYTALDSSIRVLTSQVTHQRSFLATMKDYLLDENDGIDFKSIFLIIKNCVDAKAVAVSTVGAATYDKTSKDYNYWLERAIKLFNGDSLTVVRQEIKTAIQNRIDLCDLFLTSLTYQIGHTIKDWSYNHIVDAFGQVQIIQRDLQKVLNFYQVGITDFSIDEFFYVYLNVLYEYRKYFINKRMNKQDGTLWMLRQIESVLPTFIEKMVVSEPPSLDEISDINQELEVAFYDVQNSLDLKVKALRGQIDPLPPDRIIRVYIKVKYVNAITYRASIAAKDGKVIPIYRPIYKTHIDENGVETLVKPLVAISSEFAGYGVKPDDGAYYLESRERIAHQNVVQFNTTVPPDRADLKKVERIDIDFAQWDVTWGTEIDKTPIYFAAFKGIKGEMLREILAINGTSDDVMIDICNAKDESDYWTVKVPQSEWPRATGYLNDVYLKQYTPNNPEDADANDNLITSAAGVFGYALYPITEQQASLVGGSPIQGLVDELKSKTLSSTITSPQSATS